MDIASAIPVVGGVIDAFTGNSEKKQIKQQSALQDLQLNGAKQMAQLNKENQMDIWNRTNYEAQMEHIKNAGLNPALLYGKSGGGGATTGGNTVAMPTGGTAAQVDPNAKQRNMMDAAMMMANLDLIKSQTKKNEAEANATTGYKAGEATQNIEESKSRQAFNEINTKYANESLEWRLDKIAQESNIALGQAQSALAQGNVDSNMGVIKAKMESIIQGATNAAIQGAAMEKGIQLDNAKINEITNDIQRKWQELNINQSKTRYEHEDRLKAIEEYTENALKVAGIVAVGNVVRDVVGIATQKIPKGNISTTTNGKGETIRETWTRPNE